MATLGYDNSVGSAHMAAPCSIVCSSFEVADDNRFELVEIDPFPKVPSKTLELRAFELAAAAVVAIGKADQHAGVSYEDSNRLTSVTRLNQTRDVAEFPAPPEGLELQRSVAVIGKSSFSILLIIGASLSAADRQRLSAIYNQMASLDYHVGFITISSSIVTEAAATGAAEGGGDMEDDARPSRKVVFGEGEIETLKEIMPSVDCVHFDLESCIFPKPLNTSEHPSGRDDSLMVMSAFKVLVEQLRMRQEDGADTGISFTPDFGVVRSMVMYGSATPKVEFKTHAPAFVKMAEEASTAMLHVFTIGAHVLAVEIKCNQVGSLDGVLAMNTESRMMVPLIELFHDQAAARLAREHEVNRSFCKSQLKLLVSGMNTVKLSETQVSIGIGCANHSGWSKFDGGSFLPRPSQSTGQTAGKVNHMFAALSWACVVKAMPWDPLALLDPGFISTIKPRQPPMMQATIASIFSSAGGDGGGGMQPPGPSKKLKPFKFLANKDKLLQGRGPEMANVLVTYMQTEYCGRDLQLGTQEKLAKVLYKVSWGFAANDKECKFQSGVKLGEMTALFRKRCVGRQQGTRMAILDFWQHQKAGLDARAAACKPGNRCGLKLTSKQNDQCVQPRCRLCNDHHTADDDGDDDDDDDSDGGDDDGDDDC
jgi:hypothetical protein